MRYSKRFPVAGDDRVDFSCARGLFWLLWFAPEIFVVSDRLPPQEKTWRGNKGKTKRNPRSFGNEFEGKAPRGSLGSFALNKSV